MSAAAAASKASKAKAAAHKNAKAKSPAASNAVGVSGNPALLDAPAGCERNQRSHNKTRVVRYPTHFFHTIKGTNALCGVVLEMTAAAAGKKQRIVTIDVGSANLACSTSLEVSVGARVAVAVVGSYVGDVEVVAKEVDGVATSGRLLDVVSLGWDRGGRPAHETRRRRTPPSGSLDEVRSRGGLQNSSRTLVSESSDHRLWRDILRW